MRRRKPASRSGAGNATGTKEARTGSGTRLQSFGANPRGEAPGDSTEPDQPIVGMTNSAESLMPEGQREVTVFVFV